MSKTIGYGLIGCGDIANLQATAINKSNNSTLKMVMDLSYENATQFGKKHGVSHTNNADELLANPDIDAVIVSVPHHLHRALGMKVLESGKHLIMEKPVALTVEDSLALANVAATKKLKTSVAYVLRFQESVEKAKELINEGIIGKITTITAVNMSYKPESYWTQGYSKTVNTDWRASKAKSGGGVLLMNGSHITDMLYYITSLKPVRVFAEADTFMTSVEVEDTISVNIKYDNGAIGSIIAGSAAIGRGDNFNRIYGTQGQILLGNSGETLKVYTIKENPTVEKDKWIDISPSTDKVWETSRTNFIRAFSACLLNDGHLPVSINESLVSLKLCLAAYESATTKLPVEINY